MRANFSGDKSLFDTWYLRIHITSRHCIINFYWNKNTPHDYSQSHHLIRLTDIHWSWYIFKCIMLKILHNRNCLKHCIFQSRTLHLVFPYNDQYLNSCIWAIICSSLISFSESNTQNVSSGRFVLRFCSDSIMAKYGKLCLKPNILGFLSKL